MLDDLESLDNLWSKGQQENVTSLQTFKDALKGTAPV